jgi:hypothetical protein
LKVMFIYLLKKFAVFYSAQGFVTAFTKAHHRSLF